MSSLFKLVVIGVFAFGGYKLYDHYLGTGEAALEGRWRSNAEASLAEAARSGATERQLSRLSRVYGKMVYDIGDGVWKARMDGVEEVGTFEVVSRTGDCYALQTSAGASEVCLRDGQMFVRSDASGAYEVFDKL